jgi:hypothetical protein
MNDMNTLIDVLYVITVAMMIAAIIGGVLTALVLIVKFW